MKQFRSFLPAVAILAGLVCPLAAIAADPAPTSDGEAPVSDKPAHTHRIAADPVPLSDGVNAFARDVAPFLEAHCVQCHGGDKPEAELALDKYHDSPNLAQDLEVWDKVVRMLRSGQMPPPDEEQPSPEQLQAAVQTIDAEITTFLCGGPKHPGRVTIRRLNRAEYNNTVRDLVGVEFRPADDFPSDDVGNGFDNIADVLSLPPILLEKYLNAAERIVDEAFASETLRARILVHKPMDDNEREALRRNLADFATRAFRCPVSEDDVRRLSGLARTARDRGASDADAMKAPFVAVLTSPHFLFRIEQDPAEDDEDGIRELNDYEVATRLSYFLWSTMPDEELFELAKKGDLRKPDVLQTQVARMLRDPKAGSLTDNFAGQWLQLRDVAGLTPDPDRFPGFDDALRDAMLRETQLFFAAMIREDRSVLEFLAADFSYVNERLARHYGISGVQGDEFQRVTLPGRRRGVLTHASILALTSNPTRTSPVKRGKWILENILGEPPPPPPAGVPELDETEVLGTLRERMEQHRSDESCAVCHRQMDTLGFGLENFDVVGAWRDRDGRFDIDPAGTLPGGREFRNAGELMQILADQKKDEFCRCLAEKMLIYALGRGLGVYDRCAVDRILGELAERDYRFSALVSGIATSDPFLMREGKGDD